MDNFDLYQMLLQGKYQTVKDEAMRMKAVGDSPTADCILSLTYALSKETNSARELLQNINQDDCSDKTRSICMEAKMLLAVLEKEDTETTEELGRQALSPCQDAVFAHRVLGRIEESRKNPKAALQHYQAVLNVCPDSQRTLLDCARALAALKNRQDALRYIHDAQPSIRREIYRFSLQRNSLLKIGIIILAMVLILTPCTSIPAFWSFVIIGLLAVLTGIRQGDNLIFATGLFTEIITAVIMMLKFLLQIIPPG